MNRDGLLDISDLRQALTDEALLAPGSAGIIEAAEARATFLRRRRMVAGTAVVVVTTALALVSAGLLVPDARQQMAEQQRQRGPLQVTVGLPPESGYSVVHRGIRGSKQYMEIRAERPRQGEVGARVVVHDPGTYDGEPLRRGEPITVQGGPGYFVPDFDLYLSGYPDTPAEPRNAVPAAGWQDESGQWVIVLGDQGNMNRPGVLRVAEDLRLGAPRDLLAPFHLNYLPEGYVPVDATVSGSTIPTYATPPGFALRLSPGDPQVRELRIIADAVEEHLGRGVYVPAGEGSTMIGGRKTWYVESGTSASVRVEVGDCDYHFFAMGTDRLPRSELNRIVEHAQLRDCSNLDGWTRPLP